MKIEAKDVNFYYGDFHALKNINMQMEDGDGKVLKSWKIGTPDFERKGISSYQIERIFTDTQKTSLSISEVDLMGISISFEIDFLAFFKKITLQFYNGKR